MNLTGILKSLLLVVLSMIIWSTTTTFTQGLGYIIALAGMVYYAFSSDSMSTPRRSLGSLRGYLLGLLRSSQAEDASHVSGAFGEYRSVSDNFEDKFEDSFLLDDVDGGNQSEAYSEGRRSEASSRESVEKTGALQD